MRVVLLACALLGGCSRSGTGALIELLGTGSVDQIDVRGTWNGAVHGPDRTTARSPITLPTQLLILLPDAALTARFDISASLGGAPSGDGSTGDLVIQPHSIVHASVILAPPGSDLSALPDQTPGDGSPDDGPPADLATASDLAGADFAGADLKPLPDLAILADLAPIADLAVVHDLAPPCVGPRCPYTYRRRVTVSNGSGSTLPIGYTVRIPLPNLTGKIRGDFNDLRVFEDVPNQELDRIVDAAPPGQSPAAWIALGATIAVANSDNNYWLYYGDAAAAAGPQNGSNVFAFYDDFPGTTINGHWTTNGSPSVSGGLLTLHQNTPDGVRSDYVNDKVPVLAAFEIRAAVSTAASGTNLSYWWWAGWQRQNDFVETDPWILWIQRAPSTVQAERQVPGGNCNSICAETPALTLDNNFHWHRIERGAVSTVFFYDGVQKYAVADANSSGDDYSLMIRNYAATSALTVDWVRARALANPEPTVTLGAEEILH